VTQTKPLEALRDSICNSGDRLIQSLDGLTSAQLNWVPPAEGANSIYAIVNHAIGTHEGHIIGRIFGQEVEQRPRAGWGVEGEGAEPLRERWKIIRPRIHELISNATNEDLERDCAHPRIGTLSGWEMLLLVNRHNSEHVGHAELTRDLVKAAGI
jgi:DinB family protein